MASESSAPTPAAVALFQKAHNRIVTLQRIDEQISGLLDQRRKLQEELRQVQHSINEEFEKVIRAADDSASRLASAMSGEHAPVHLSGSVRVGRIELVESDAA